MMAPPAWCGFTARILRSSGLALLPGWTEIVETAHLAGALVIDDLGSGSFLDTAVFGLTHEPMVQESINAGADIVCFSGDKLLGGPQAGIIIGRKDLLDKIKKHPLARAIRADKLCLAGVSATLSHYLKGETLHGNTDLEDDQYAAGRDQTSRFILAGTTPGGRCDPWRINRRRWQPARRHTSNLVVGPGSPFAGKNVEDFTECNSPGDRKDNR